MNKEDFIKDLKWTAKLLIDDGSNEEYTRGICELIADMDGHTDVFHADRTEEIKKELLE